MNLAMYSLTESFRFGQSREMNIEISYRMFVNHSRSILSLSWELEPWAT